MAGSGPVSGQIMGRWVIGLFEGGYIMLTSLGAWSLRRSLARAM